MKKFLPLALSILLLAGCSQTNESDEITQETRIEDNVAVDSDEVNENSVNESVEENFKTFFFGGVSYQLDYPSMWTYSEETYDSGGVYTQFYDDNSEKTMMVDCDWQGGMEAEILKSDNRTFEKQGELVKVAYTVFGTQENIGNGNISLRLDEWSEEKSPDYYCQIFFQPKVAEIGLVEEIFSSIR